MTTKKTKKTKPELPQVFSPEWLTDITIRFDVDKDKKLDKVKFIGPNGKSYDKIPSRIYLTNTEFLYVTGSMDTKLHSPKTNEYVIVKYEPKIQPKKETSKKRTIHKQESKNYS